MPLSFVQFKQGAYSGPIKNEKKKDAVPLTLLPKDWLNFPHTDFKIISKDSSNENNQSSHLLSLLIRNESFVSFLT